jgi:hypothetical protein
MNHNKYVLVIVVSVIGGLLVLFGGLTLVYCSYFRPAPNASGFNSVPSSAAARAAPSDGALELVVKG